MLVVTGGAGFIGSALIWKLNQENYYDIIVADRLGTGVKWKNLAKRRLSRILHKDELLDWLNRESSPHSIEAIFHLGACSSTTELDADYLMKNNLSYSIDLFNFCVEHSIPFIYASSAATYGAGELGFCDDPNTISSLRPINPYGFSKQLFDSWVARQKSFPPSWAGLKFFNVYGPQEYHKGSQASVPFHLFPQLRDCRKVKLFKSYREDIPDGDQRRDFIYVKDTVDVIWHFFENRNEAQSGIYNVGTGKARTFADLGRAVIATSRIKDAVIEWIDMPESLRSQYQYFTEADLTNLRRNGKFKGSFTNLEDGIDDYVGKYLSSDDPYL